MSVPNTDFTTTPAAANPVGEQLRQWRQRRRMSQLDFACEAGISTRLGTPVDVTLSELALESFFPADERTAEAVRNMDRTAG